MKKSIFLSLISISNIYALDLNLSTIDVSSTTLTEVAKKAKKSADVSEVLSKNVPGVDMSRRSGIANDILIRGQKRDNISVEVDGTKVYGACPNRMDPPISHIVSNQIKSISVIEGPYDVTNYGNMSGGVKITTKEPTKEVHENINVAFGSWNYKKFGATIEGGTDRIKLLLSASEESSDQYRDGKGETLTQQVKNSDVPSGNKYQKKYEELQAYKKNSFMAKAFVNTLQNQQLRLAITANRSDNVLYANSPMDAISDDSNIYSISYNIKNISDTYKNINLQYYYSDVDHPMSTEYRNAALNPTMNKTNHMWTKTQGIKLKNNLNYLNYKILLGLDSTQREWRGKYINNVTNKFLGNSIDKALSINSALFARIQKNYNNLNIKIGARYDYTTTKDRNDLHQSNTYNNLNLNIFTTYKINNNNNFFIGLGEASRAPDARELYFVKSGKTIGTPNLKESTNREFDMGYKLESESLDIKIKAFYSILHNYIYINADKNSNIFENIDAKVYGAEFSATYYLSDDITIDMLASYKNGTKDKALKNQTNKNLADMAPLKGSIAVNYEYANNSLATIEALARDTWRNYDYENGEQHIAAYSILNLKIKHQINKKFNFTLGVNNIMDKNYAKSNTYADLTLITSGTAKKLLLNEPGRYIYTNLDFKF